MTSVGAKPLGLMEMRSSSDRMVFDLYELFMKQTG